MIKLTAQEIYLKLSNDLKGKTGSIQIDLAGITIKYNNKDAVGNLLQEWFQEWLNLNNIYHRTKTNTQSFPDFQISESNIEGLLELKSFDTDASPNYDLAQFDAYNKSLLTNPERIDSDYLIIGYKMRDSVITISDIWLKKIWEMSTHTGKHPLTLQKKGANKETGEGGVIHNLRPFAWHTNNDKNKLFKDKLSFIKAIASLHESNPQCNNYKENWLERVKTKYKEVTGNDL